MGILWSAIRGSKSVNKEFRTKPVSRITLFCRDLNRSLELYRDILGFEEVEKKTIQSKAFNELMNIDDEDCFVKISYLQSEESDFDILDLPSLKLITLAPESLIRGSGILKTGFSNVENLLLNLAAIC